MPAVRKGDQTYLQWLLVEGPGSMGREMSPRIRKNYLRASKDGISCLGGGFQMEAGHCLLETDEGKG